MLCDPDEVLDLILIVLSDDAPAPPPKQANLPQQRRETQQTAVVPSSADTPTRNADKASFSSPLAAPPAEAFAMV